MFIRRALTSLTRASTLRTPVLRPVFPLHRAFSDYPMSDYERKIFMILQEQLEPAELEVEDISGGCGSMFAINVVSPKFKGLSMVKQHKLVNSILADEIAQWHGLQLKTKAAKD